VPVPEEFSEMLEFLLENWFFILVALLMIACHLFHPGHGGHHGDGQDKKGDGP